MAASRRDFIRLTCCSAAGAALTAGFNRFGLINAMAQTVTDYKALVCIFMFGGNDGNNLVIPLTTSGYASYNTLRGGLALPQAALLPVTPRTANIPFGLHPRLTELQSLFGQNKVAILTNVGTLVKPLTRTQYQARAVTVPSNLFSHSDQQTQWQTSLSSGGASGWAGRTADKILSANSGASYPTVVSLAGTNIFCNGVQTRPATIIAGNPSGLSGNDGSATAATRNLALQQLLTFDSGLNLVQAANTTTSRALADSKTLTDALLTASALATPFPNTSIGAQLLQVAKIIQVRAALGLKRQIFFCSMGGFDTHTNQITQQDQLMSQISPAMAAFYNATVELGVSSQVTTFSLSEFGRTFQQASGGGSDHGWGSHHFIAGGAVQGGDFYGVYPTLALNGPDDAANNGRWIPTTSLDQYGATLASWFGVSGTDLSAVFPNLSNFAAPKLAFLG